MNFGPYHGHGHARRHGHDGTLARVRQAPRPARTVFATCLLLLVGCSATAAEPARGGGAALLLQLDTLAARAARLEGQAELEAGAVAALRDVCAPYAVDHIVIEPGHVAGRCVRPAGLGIHRITSAKLSGREAEDLGRPSHSNHLDELVAGAADATGGEPAPKGTP